MCEFLHIFLVQKGKFMSYQRGFSIFRLMREKRDKLFFKNYILTPVIILGLVFNISFVKMPDSVAQGNIAFLREVRALDCVAGAGDGRG